MQSFTKDESGKIYFTVGKEFVTSAIQCHGYWLANNEHGVKAKFKGCDLRDSDFSNARLELSDFRDTNLVGCKFTGTNLYHADFSGADCTGIDFTGANLWDCNFEGANLADTNFTAAKGFRYWGNHKTY